MLDTVFFILKSKPLCHTLSNAWELPSNIALQNFAYKMMAVLMFAETLSNFCSLTRVETREGFLQQIPWESILSLILQNFFFPRLINYPAGLVGLSSLFREMQSGDTVVVIKSHDLYRSF